MIANTKRGLALALAICFLLCLSGCSGKDNKQPPASSPSGEYDENGGFRPSVPDRKQELTQAVQENGDSVAWLTLPNTEIDDVVVQGENNEFYLRKDAKKNYSYAGCYYMDYENTVGEDETDFSQNTIIYGHNLGKPMGVKDDPNGDKFAQLLKLTYPETAKNTPYIFLTTKNGEYIYEIFAVFYSEAMTKPVPYHLVNYSEDDFNELIEDVKSRSLYLYDTQVSAQDKVLTLSTCSYKYGSYSQNPDQRFVVMGRLVQDGEPYYEQAQMMVNDMPREPEFD